MKRLTFDGLFCDIVKCDSTPGGTFCETGTCTIRRVWERLKEYEDTGLEPEEIKNALDVNDIMPEINVTVGQLRNILQAEQDGRLVVLPCGTDVELVRDGYVFKADHWNHTLTAFRDEPKNKSGKQIALFSTKEAEAALKGASE